MKKLLIKLIKMYQKIPGNFHYSCRFYPTCSHYAIDALNEYGTIKGSILSICRILRCNPFSKPGYDPVIKRSEKNEKAN
jgi:putative membrane protein insertion efficiency factor